MAHRYRPAPVSSLARVRVWSDAPGTVRAVLTTEDGQPIRSNDPATGQPVDGLLVADERGQLPEFLCASNPVYVGPSGSAVRLDPVGEGDGAEVSQLQVYGTPGAGKVPTWNATTKRLEWQSAASSADDLFIADDEIAGYGYWGINVTVPAGVDPTYQNPNLNGHWYLLPAATAHTFADIDPAFPADPTPGGVFLAVAGKNLGTDQLPLFPLPADWVPVAASQRWLAATTKANGIVAYADYAADHTVVVPDIGHTLRMAHPTTALTVTLPVFDDGVVVVGSTVEIMRYGAGTVTVAAGAGATVVTNAAGLGIATRYGSAVAEKTTSTEWVVRGDLA